LAENLKVNKGLSIGAVRILTIKLIEMDKFEQHIKRMKGLRDVYEVGTGQHNILSILISECDEALRQPSVVGSISTTSKAMDDYEFNMKRHWRDEPKTDDDDYGGTIKHFQD